MSAVLYGRPVASVDEQNIEPAIAVIIEKCATRTQSFGQQFAAKGAVVVSKVQAGFTGYVNELEPETLRHGKR